MREAAQRTRAILTLFLSGGAESAPPWGFSCAVPSLVEITTWNFANFPKISLRSFSCIFFFKNIFGEPPEALFEGHVRRFLTTKSSMVKPCWRVHFLCKSNAVLGDEIPYLCLQNGYLGFPKFWLFYFKILKNQQFVFQHTQLFYFYNYQKTVDTYPRYCTLDCTYQVSSWYLDNVLNYNKKNSKNTYLFSVKKRFSRISLELWHVAARGSQHCFLRANTYQIICLYTREVNADVIGDPRQGHSRSPRVFPNNSW